MRDGNQMKNCRIVKRRTSFLIMLGIFMLMFTGCRTSPVLEQILYQQNQEPDKDNDVNAIDNNEEHDQEDEQLSAKKEVDDADSKRDQTREDAVSGDDKDKSDKSYDSNYDDNAPNMGKDNQSSSDNAESDGSGTGEESKPETVETSGHGTGAEDSEAADRGEENGEPESTDQDDSGEDDETGGNGNLDDGNSSGNEYEPGDEEQYKQIVDARGESVDVPEDVEKVTAVGEIATIVEMLGGSNRLLASSGSFTGNSMVQSAFSSQGVSGVQTWWDGDGSGTISSGNFDALLAAEPDVCFEISGQDTFSSSQIDALEDAGIAYVVLPALKSLDNITSAVQIVGEVLGDRSADGGTNAPSIAGDYADWSDSVVGKVQGKGSEKNTLFISEWDSSVLWEIKNETSGVWQSGYGGVIGMKKSGTSPLNDCMSIANLKNGSADNVYINPLRNNYWLHYYSGGKGVFNYGENRTRTSSGVGLGNEAFPAIIVADSSIVSNIQDDIHWQVYGRVTDGAGNTAYGFTDGNGNIIGTTIEGEYGIYVNPKGVGSWTDGSVESPLEAAWLSCKFQNGISMDELRGMVSDFYSTFYHTSADTGSILGE